MKFLKLFIYIFFGILLSIFLKTDFSYCASPDTLLTDNEAMYLITCFLVNGDEKQIETFLNNFINSLIADGTESYEKYQRKVIIYASLMLGLGLFFYFFGEPLFDIFFPLDSDFSPDPERIE